MANEYSKTIQVIVSDAINGGTLSYQSNPINFQGSMTVVRGPYPGMVTVPIDGVNVAFTPLARPAEIWLHNIDKTNYVEFGVHDGSIFHPIGELLPGHMATFRLSRNIGVEENVPGTGTTGVVNQFFLRANKAACDVRVDAWDA